MGYVGLSDEIKRRRDNHIGPRETVLTNESLNEYCDIVAEFLGEPIEQQLSQTVFDLLDNDNKCNLNITNF